MTQQQKQSSDVYYDGWYYIIFWVLNVILDWSVNATMVNGWILSKCCVYKAISKPIQSKIMMDTFDSKYDVEIKWLKFTE